MKVTKRGTDVKRHTTHYLVGGKWRTRRESTLLAGQGRIDGVTVYRGKYGRHIQALPSTGMKLYDLPEVVK